MLTMNCETSRNHSLLRKQVHTWVALRTVVRGTLIDSTQPHIQALREGYQQGVPGFFYNDGMDAAVWCAGALNCLETGRLCEMQSWVHYSVVASAVIDGGCCWAQESAPKVNCRLCYRWAICLNSHSGMSLLHLCMDMSLCPMDLNPGSCACSILSKHQLSPLFLAMLFANKGLRYVS